MSTLPKCILVAVCNHSASTEKKDLVNTLQEYFNSIPHIKHTDCKGGTCYIFLNNGANRNILYGIGHMDYSNMWDVFGFIPYDLECDTSLFVTYSRSLRSLTRPFLNSHYCPYSININPTDKRKLRLLMEG